MQIIKSRPILFIELSLLLISLGIFVLLGGQNSVSLTPYNDLNQHSPTIPSKLVPPSITPSSVTERSHGKVVSLVSAADTRLSTEASHEGDEEANFLKLAPCLKVIADELGANRAISAFAYLVPFRLDSSSFLYFQQLDADRMNCTTC